ncbi:hypothetical protein [Caldicellulosiruptor naganoensis]|uniref:DUF2993 domain-containing protein n=1 Tax=Caldicellulosiruptor naganoensis TaxID=29324 RepID=A0ABY7BG87_9FIRM|nr:hypothetical protein [Caldicellulosiruptor naganoensis]WAM31589.1 hypothetical protein OTJ99_000013 [Caldicellulosiruptor naganoensis]
MKEARAANIYGDLHMAALFLLQFRKNLDFKYTPIGYINIEGKFTQKILTKEREDYFMGKISTSVEEIVFILSKNTSFPDLVKEIDVVNNEINVKIKPVNIFPELVLKFSIVSEGKIIKILFDPSKSIIIYGFLFGKFKKSQIEGVNLFKDRLEIDIEKIIFQNLKGLKVKNVMVTNTGDIKIEFFTEKGDL